MKKKIHFIINPISGTSDKRGFEEHVEKHLNKSRFSYEIDFTKAPKHAETIAKKAAEAGVDIVAAVGGDGTLNEVACSLIDTETALAIIPSGSGNGLARHLGISRRIDSALKIINDPQEVLIDTFLANDHCLINVGGSGFDGFIAEFFSKTKKRGFASYASLTIKNLFSYSAFPYYINVDGQEIKGKAFLIAYANSEQYGNNIYIAPRANVSDGVLDICIIEKFPFTQWPMLLNMLTRKKWHVNKYIKRLKGKNIKATFKEPVPFHIDGECFKAASEVNITTKPKSLKVLVPKKSNDGNETSMI